jgi:hypothetical protein
LLNLDSEWYYPGPGVKLLERNGDFFSPIP